MTNANLKSGFITKNGNILNTKLGIFQKANGEFLRFVGAKEMEQLKSVLSPVTFENGIPEPTELPIWEFQFEKTVVDDSKYVFGKETNGGCYSKEIRSLFFKRILNGITEYAKLDYHWCSSEFPMTDNGNHQRSGEIQSVPIIDADAPLEYRVWSPYENAKDLNLLDVGYMITEQEFSA